MHHTSAYAGSVTAANVETDIPALADGVLVIQNTHFLPQRPMRLLYAGVASLTMSRGRLSSPTLDVITSPFIRDINVAANMGDPQRLANYVSDPLQLSPLEELRYLHTHTSAIAEVNYGVVGLEWQQMPQPAGSVFTIRGTAVGTLVANAWTQVGVITFQNQLPTGTYACVGANFISAGCLAGRLTFENQVPRPGGLGVLSVGGRTDPIFRFGGLGTWGIFRNYAMPTVEILSVSADVAEEIYLDLVKIG